MASLLLTSDWHLTDHPHDAYRFRFIDWLCDQAAQHHVDGICMLGDLTDAKDRHSARFVNRVVEALSTVANTAPLVILKGNHDYVDAAYPFFAFLNRIPNIQYVVDRAALQLGTTRPVTIYAVGHHRELDWQATLGSLGQWDQAQLPGLVLIHQTLTGAEASNGFQLDGLDPNLFAGDYPFQVYSGDIHVPQQIGRVTYIGSPYHVHFGDQFTPRVILWTPRKQTDLYWEGLERRVLSIKDPAEIYTHALHKGDQVKVRLRLPRSQYADWAQYESRTKQICQDLGVELFGVSLEPMSPRKRLIVDQSGSDEAAQTRLAPEVIVEQFAQRERLDGPTTLAGKRLVHR